MLFFLILFLQCFFYYLMCGMKGGGDGVGLNVMNCFIEYCYSLNETEMAWVQSASVAVMRVVGRRTVDTIG